MKYTKRIILASLALLLGSCTQKYYKTAAYHHNYRNLIDSYIYEASNVRKIEKPALQTKAAALSHKQQWWTQEITKNLFPSAKQENINPLSLYSGALKHSPQVKVFSELPLIREASIEEATGRFDVHVFLESKWEKNRNPRSSISQTADSVFHEEEYSVEAGLKRKLETGGELVVSQRFSHLDDNSISLSPNAQAKSNFTVSFLQPLLKGAGVKYNTSIIDIAKLDVRTADEEFKRQITSHLSQVNSSYWALYLARAQYLINKRLHDETQEITQKLQKRGDIDTVKSQLLRAEAALAKRETTLIRSEISIKNTESRLKILVNSPKLKRATQIELLPNYHPQIIEYKESLKQVLVTALKNRPEIDQAFLQLQALDIRKDMANNELLPQLNLILESSYGGLDHDTSYGDSYNKQWGHDSYLAGLSYDFPIQNRAAKARYRRRNLEFRQQMEQINATIDTTLFEVKVSYRELETARREIAARYKSLMASTNELKSIKKRWDIAELRAEKGGATYMQFLLDSQERKAEAEESYLKSLVHYSVAMENLERAKGTLLQFNKVRSSRTVDETNHLPTNNVFME